jgi:hypothetical protein
MAEPEQVREPTELIYVPGSSSAPLFFALGAMLVVNGIYGEGFLFRGWVYLLVGAIVLLAALRSMITSGVRDFYGRPRKQAESTAVLPAASLRPPRRG